jgi:hypothetical protein
VKKRRSRSADTSLAIDAGYVPARPLDGVLADVGREDLQGIRAASSPSASRSAIASEYASSPVEQPATQARSGSLAL